MRREGVGVQLYGMQQQLARLQVALEQTHADFNGLGEGRARAELDADSAKQRYAELKGVGDALSKRVVKNESELNALQETLRQVRLLRAYSASSQLFYSRKRPFEFRISRTVTYIVISAGCLIHRANSPKPICNNNFRSG